MLKKIHSFTNHFKTLYQIDHDPFRGFVIGTEKYEDPIPLTEDEYEYIQNHLIDDPELQIIQKMFILQTFFGVRYVDYRNAKKKDIVNDCLLAYPRKTIKHLRKVSIPLNDFGAEIIGDLYDETADAVYLVPRYTLDQYNVKLKELFKKLGLDRIITKYDEESDQTIHLPLHDVISSHIARRTFVNTLINEGYDSITIKNMCGMSENSREISRYYNLNEKHKQECANSLDKRKHISTVPTYHLVPIRKDEFTNQNLGIV